MIISSHKLIQNLRLQDERNNEVENMDELKIETYFVRIHPPIAILDVTDYRQLSIISV